MELVNFTLRPGYELHIGTWELDLHNCYDLLDCSHDEKRALASITFRRNNTDCLDASLPKEIRLTCESVNRYISRPGNFEKVDDKGIIQYVGFLYSDDPTMDGFLDEMTDPTQDLVIGMEDDAVYKIHADRIVAELAA